MIRIDIDPVIFSVGPISFRWYGLMYVVGIAIGLLVAWPYAKKKGLVGPALEEFIYWAIPCGLLGARLYYVIQTPPLIQYIQHPIRIIAVWDGGMAFYGAVFSTLIVALIFGLKGKLPFWKIMDMAAIFAIVGQFFGRIGNFINGDVVGYPTTAWWGVIYVNPNSFVADHTIAYQPAAAFEAFSNIIIFILLWNLRNRLKPGFLFLFYLLAYSVSQVILFFWRDNVIIALGLKQAQLTAIACIIAGIGLFIWQYRRQRGMVEVKTDSPPPQQ
jgi:phosphatidylglycerol---prolipoprotein diacylglyceryl transferase